MEKIQLPFLLTSNIVTLIGPLLFKARFIPIMGIAARAIHTKQDDMEAIWRLLMQDDLSFILYLSNG
jgi:hypothetical protein